MFKWHTTLLILSFHILLYYARRLLFAVFRPPNDILYYAKTVVIIQAWVPLAEFQITKRLSTGRSLFGRCVTECTLVYIYICTYVRTLLYVKNGYFCYCIKATIGSRLHIEFELLILYASISLFKYTYYKLF